MNVEMKREILMEEFYQSIEQEYRSFFKELVEYAGTLGYYPIRNKTQDLSIDFRNNKTKQTIMKMETKEQKHDGYQYGERNVPGLRLKFYASNDYSLIFQKAIQRVIEAFDGKYTGCYGCGRCKDTLLGYRYVYPDGKKVFRCGSELISIFDFSKEDLAEIKKLMKVQSDFWNNHASLKES